MLPIADPPTEQVSSHETKKPGVLVWAFDRTICVDSYFATPMTRRLDIIAPVKEFCFFQSVRPQACKCPYAIFQSAQQGVFVVNLTEDVLCIQCQFKALPAV